MKRHIISRPPSINNSLRSPSQLFLVTFYPSQLKPRANVTSPILQHLAIPILNRTPAMHPKRRLPTSPFFILFPATIMPRPDSAGRYLVGLVPFSAEFFHDLFRCLVFRSILRVHADSNSSFLNGSHRSFWQKTKRERKD
ncbi:hypothetical protein J3E68DRAFT_61743 [Trichoderma sp. SZMC 28012]